MKKQLALIFCIVKLLPICTMDQGIQQDLLINVLYNPDIVNLVIDHSTLKDSVTLFFVDKAYNNGYYGKISELYIERVPQELRSSVKDFDTFVKMFCTCNDWVENREIPQVVRKKLLPFYVQYHCQDYHIPILERLGIVAEDDENETGVKIFKNALTSELLFKRYQEDIFNKEKIDDLNAKLSKALYFDSNDLLQCFQALMNGADPNFYSKAWMNDKRVNALCKMFTMGYYNEEQRPIIFLLLYCGATIRSDETFAHLPLSLAAYSDDVELVTLLLKNGVNPRNADDSGATPLHWLCSSSIHKKNYYAKLVIAKLLLEHGANIYAKNDNNMDAHICLFHWVNGKEARWALIRYFADCKAVLEGRVTLRGFAEFPLPAKLVRY